MTDDVKAYLIDPFSMSIRRANWDRSLDQLYQLLKVDRVEIVHLPNGDAVYVDEEGRLKPMNRMWIHNEYPQSLLRGRGLYVGPVTYSGDDSNPRASLYEVYENVFFITQNGGFMRAYKKPDKV